MWAQTAANASSRPPPIPPTQPSTAKCTHTPRAYLPYRLYLHNQPHLPLSRLAFLTTRNDSSCGLLFNGLIRSSFATWQGCSLQGSAAGQGKWFGDPEKEHRHSLFQARKITCLVSKYIINNSICGSFELFFSYGKYWALAFLKVSI